jgi:hypothetical protein
LALSELAGRDAVSRDAYTAELHELLLPVPGAECRVKSGTEAFDPG